MFEKALICGIYSITPVHVGSGSELSVIDLPIQRERHTQYPIIWGQSLKGVLRSKYRAVDNSNNKLKTEIIFGPDTEKASERAGAISVGDAKILLFPVRSLKGVFAYVTCPFVLERFLEDLKMIKSFDNNFKVPFNINALNESIRELCNKLKSSDAIVYSDALVITIKECNNKQNNDKKDINKEKVVLEDLVFDAKKLTDGNQVKVKVKDLISKIIDIILKIVPMDEDKLKQKLVIVTDDVFKSFVTMATEIVARIKIDAEKGTVEEGGLWYEEFLPSDTSLYSIIAISKPRVAGKTDDERKRNLGEICSLFNVKRPETVKDKIKDELKNTFDEKYIQIGGDETVGKGFVKVRIYTG